MANTKVAVGIAVAIVVVLGLAVGSAVTGAGFGLPAPGFILGILLLMIANFALVVAAIVHALVRDDLTGVQRLVWIAIVFFVTPIVALGAIVYFAMGRARTRELFRDVTRDGRAAS